MARPSLLITPRPKARARILDSPTPMVNYWTTRLKNGITPRTATSRISGSGCRASPRPQPVNISICTTAIRPPATPRMPKGCGIATTRACGTYQTARHWGIPTRRVMAILGPQVALPQQQFPAKLMEQEALMAHQIESIHQPYWASQVPALLPTRGGLVLQVALLAMP